MLNPKKFPQFPDNNFPKEKEIFIKNTEEQGHFVIKKDWKRDEKTGNMQFVNEEQINS